MVLKFFEIFSQPSGLVGKPNHPVHYIRFAGMIVWILFFVWVSYFSFEIGIAFLLFCWIPDFVRNFLTKFQNLSESFGLVEN